MVALTLLIHLALLALATPAHAESSALDIAVIRANVEAARAAVVSVQFDGTQSMSVTRNGEPLRPPAATDLRLWYMPDRARIEASSDRGSNLTVFDGTATTMYVDKLNQYTQVRGLPNLSSSVADGPPQSLRDAILDRVFPPLPEGATVLRQERLALGDGEVDCVVVTHPIQPAGGGPESAGTITVWIELQTWATRQGTIEAARELAPGVRADTSALLELTTLQIDPPLTDEVFKFEAPEGAELVDSFMPPSQQPRNWVGQEAPDFALDDTEGNSYQLSELRGKVVLLNFWATWCSPCKIELPHIEKLRKEFDEELVVLTASHEAPQRVRDFLAKTGYGFPSLVDPGGSVTLQYGATTIPVTLLIDREGIVAKHYVGAQPEATFRSGLAELGLE